MIQPDMLISAFRDALGVTGRPFGGAPLSVVGISDDATGVQWNAGLHLRTGEAYVGVNLEGMAYDDWPISRFIARERFRPHLHSAIEHTADTHTVVLRWWRDCWQAGSRVSILEGEIAPTPIPLDHVTAEVWQKTLQEAEQCLDQAQQFRGRRTITVTLAASGRQVDREVSPHLQFRAPLVMTADRASQADLVRSIRRARDLLLPLYRFVEDRTRPGHF